jgi:hypothetical protein
MRVLAKYGRSARLAHFYDGLIPECLEPDHLDIRTLDPLQAAHTAVMEGHGNR